MKKEKVNNQKKMNLYTVEKCNEIGYLLKKSHLKLR